MKYANIALILVLSACGQKNVEFSSADSVVANPATPAQCAAGGVDLKVNGVTYAVCNGLPGPTGPKGIAGAPAAGCTVFKSDAGFMISCPDGSDTSISEDGDKKSKPTDDDKK